MTAVPTGGSVRDRIDINGLRVMAVVGALHHERLAAQPLEIDLSLEVDLHDAGTSDELGDTVNYGAVTERVASVVAESKDILLERLAERIAACAVAFDRVDAVNVTLTKLRPPIAATVENTAVRIRRFRGDFDIKARASHRAIVALGSNLGDREAYLRFAIGDFAHVRAVSHVYETAPVGGPDDQAAFLNMVIEVETSLDPFAFLRHCHRIEADALAPTDRPLGAPHARRRSPLLRRHHDRQPGVEGAPSASRRAPVRPGSVGRCGTRALSCPAGRRHCRLSR